MDSFKGSKKKSLFLVHSDKRSIWEQWLKWHLLRQRTFPFLRTTLEHILHWSVTKAGGSYLESTPSFKGHFPQLFSPRGKWEEQLKENGSSRSSHLLIGDRWSWGGFSSNTLKRKRLVTPGRPVWQEHGKSFHSRPPCEPFQPDSDTAGFRWPWRQISLFQTLFLHQIFESLLLTKHSWNIERRTKFRYKSKSKHHANSSIIDWNW